MRADTIFALSSGAGRAAISVVRVSGPGAGRALTSLSVRSGLPTARRATLAELAYQGRRIDKALVFWLPGPGTATGEDMVELHLHGGGAVLRSALAALGAVEGLRLAEPGEFSRRAFLNGKLDLTQAEGIADLIDAETEMQAEQALSQIDGRVRDLYESWRERILKGLAYVEAVLDFPDEDVPDSAGLAIAPELKSVSDEIASHLSDGNRGEILREGLSVVILGAPNSGKSTLLNVLAKRDVAIVSDLAGTTRDVLEVRLNVNGYAVNIADTAGLRETREAIEAEGIRRALRRAEAAQLRLLLIDPESVSDLPNLARHLEPDDLVLWSKSELGWKPPQISHHSLAVSSHSGIGIGELVKWIGGVAQSRAGVAGGALVTRARHREALAETTTALNRGLVALTSGLDLAAEDFRMAARSIGRITGRADVENVLDIVFREFCIGK